MKPNQYSNGKMHAEEVDVVAWYYPARWGKPGETGHQEYRWHCIGGRWAGAWTLDMAEANRREPELDKEGRSEMVAALRAALGRALGIPVRAFPSTLILWVDSDAPANTPCPYRHGNGTGYATVQLQLIRAMV